jgi:hypothetical protein
MFVVSGALWPIGRGSPGRGGNSALRPLQKGSGSSPAPDHSGGTLLDPKHGVACHRPLPGDRQEFSWRRLHRGPVARPGVGALLAAHFGLRLWCGVKGLQ